MLSIATAYSAMILQIYKSISEKQKNTQELYIKIINVSFTEFVSGVQGTVARHLLVALMF